MPRPAPALLLSLACACTPSRVGDDDRHGSLRDAPTRLSPPDSADIAWSGEPPPAPE